MGASKDQLLQKTYVPNRPSGNGVIDGLDGGSGNDTLTGQLATSGLTGFYIQQGAGAGDDTSLIRSTLPALANARGVLDHSGGPGSDHLKTQVAASGSFNTNAFMPGGGGDDLLEYDIALAPGSTDGTWVVSAGGGAGADSLRFVVDETTGTAAPQSDKLNVSVIGESGSGDDVLSAHYISAGLEGDYTARLTSGNGADEITSANQLGAGSHSLNISLSGGKASDQIAQTTLIDASARDGTIYTHIFGGSGNDSLATSTQVQADGGYFVLRESIYGWAGHDQIVAQYHFEPPLSPPATQIKAGYFGGTGNDGITFLLTYNVISHGTGNLIGDLEVFGGSGHDTISVISPDLNLFYELDGGTGNDVLFARGGKARMDGGRGWDWLDAGGKNDLLDAGAGNDTLIGGGGDDTLIGGTGADSFRFNLDAAFGHDKIIDFNRCVDELYFTDAAGDRITDLADLDAQITLSGLGSTIKLTAQSGATITLADTGIIAPTSLADLFHDPGTQLLG